MLWVSLPLEHNLVLVYLSGMVAATALEYVTGAVMERIFKMKYWDYSGKPFNLNGYICLESSIAWGFLSIFLTEIIHKPIERLVLGTSPFLEIVLVSILSIVFAADTAASIKQAFDLGRALEAMTKMKAELDDLQLQIALLKAETTQKVTDLRDEHIQRAAAFKGETELRIFELKKEAEFMAAARKEEWGERVKKTAGDLSSLAAKFQSVSDSRRKLSEHLGYYQKELLRGNPSASSKQFSEALKELKSALSLHKRQGR